MATATRSEVLTTARSAGYSGDAKWESFQTWTEENNMKFPGVDLKTAWDTPTNVEIPVAAKPEPKARGLSDAARGVAEVNAAEMQADAGRALSPASYRRMAERKNYDRGVQNGDKNRRFTDAEVAEKFGAYMRLQVFQNRPYSEKSNDLDILGKAFLSNNPISGADFIPEEFVPEVIRNVEEYGAYQKVHSPRSITGTEWTEPKYVTAPTVYYPGEGQTITESSGTTQVVKGYTKEGFVLTNASLTELEASAINISDYIAKNFATALTLDQDQKCLLGDGTSTYAHFTGWIPAMNAVASNGMVISASGNLFSEWTYADFTNVMGALPYYALSSPNCKWLMNSAVYFNPTFRMALGLGGTQGEALMRGPDGSPYLLGKPVQFAQALPGTEADSTIFALLGDFSRGALFGTATNGIQIAMSDQVKFAEGLVSWRARVRWGFSVHAPGVASTKQSGPVAALKSIT